MKDSLLPYINNHIESKLDVAQEGFRTNRGTIETIASLNETILQFEKKFRGRNPVIAFLDIQKAYDSVDWNVLIRQLREEYSMPENLVWMIIELFTGVKSTIADAACTWVSGNGITVCCVLSAKNTTYSLFLGILTCPYSRETRKQKLRTQRTKHFFSCYLSFSAGR